MRHEFHRQRRTQIVFGTAAMILFWTLVLAGGYALSELIFYFTGRPGEVWTHVVPGAISICLLILVPKVFFRARRRRMRQEGHEDRRWDKIRNRFLSDTIEAMDRIAHGDFSVLLPVDGRTPFSELAESVNKMARELGSMENLRQDFISNVSHEIQSPLTSIAGFAALLKNGGLTEEQRAHYLDVIETEAGRLSKLSDNLLKLSSLESSPQPLTVTPFSLDRQIQNAVLVLEPQWAAKDLELSLELDKTPFSGDEGLLTQVWINLLHNAVKFTPEGGEIRVTLKNDGKDAVCRVSDTGVGMSQQDLMHIFERFYKADKARDRALGGSGLGLSLVKKIVELHGGAVTADSRPGEGSTFTVTLPLKK